MPLVELPMEEPLVLEPGVLFMLLSELLLPLLPMLPELVVLGLEPLGVVLLSVLEPVLPGAAVVPLLGVEVEPVLSVVVLV